MAATDGSAETGGASVRREAVIAELAALYDLTARLRRDCPWDRVQTQQDIVAYTLEETYELVDAVRGTQPDAERHHAVCGELGDLLFQVYFLAQVAEDAGWYDLGEVVAGIREKLIRRHPHIFAEAEAETPDDVRRTWDRIKRDTEGREGIFHEVPAALPATLFAHKLQQRAAAVGFDWVEAYEVLAKIREESDELERALTAAAAEPAAAAAAEPAAEPDADAPGGLAAEPAATATGFAATTAAGTPGSRGERPRVGPEAAHEVGDLLFAVVNLARKLGADPELELRMAADRFRRRVDEAARLAGSEGATFTAMGLDEQEGYYQRAKAALHGPDGGSPPPEREQPAGHTEGGRR